MEDFQGACGGATSAALYTCLGLRLRLRMGMLSMDMHDSVGEPSPSLSACEVTNSLYQRLCGAQGSSMQGQTLQQDRHHSLAEVLSTGT